MSLNSILGLVSPIYIPKEERKKRNCLRCGCVFVSKGAGHRLCGSCNDRNTTYGTMATSMLGNLPIMNGHFQRLPSVKKVEVKVVEKKIKRAPRILVDVVIDVTTDSTVMRYTRCQRKL